MSEQWASVLSYDFETTGAKPLIDRPVQIGMCDGNSRILINSLVNPCMEIAAGAVEVHGISADHVRDMPDYLIGLYTLKTTIGLFMDPLIIGYNTSMFDTPMFTACIGHDPIPGLTELDLLDIRYRYWPTAESQKLSAVHLEMTGQELVGAHGAIQDCLGVVAVLKAMCDKLGKSPRELAEELKTPKPYPIMPIGKHKGKALDNVPVSWANWMQNNASDMRPDLQATVDYVLGK